jgi:AcrR family transcriptional regulator
MTAAGSKFISRAAVPVISGEDWKTRPDAGVKLLSAHGMHGLTHRAVDSVLGLPVGSTSYYFRTRAALVTAVVRRMADLDIADAASALPEAGQISSTGQLADLLANLVHSQLTTGRARTQARFQLAAEALHNPDVRDALTRHGEQFRVAASRLLTALDFPDPPRQGRSLVAICDGLAFESLTRNQPALTRAEIRATLAEALDGMRAPPPAISGSQDLLASRQPSHGRSCASSTRRRTEPTSQRMIVCHFRDYGTGNDTRS